MMDEFYSINNHASKIAKYQNSGHDARSLIAPKIIDVDPCISNEKSNKKKSKVVNHQIKYRRTLKEVQQKMSSRMSDEQRKEMRQKSKRELWKKRQFNHVTSKVFEDSDSIQTASTISTSVEDMSSIPSVKSRCTVSEESLSNCSTSSKHKYFGEVPEYILKYRIENGRMRRNESIQPVVDGEGIADLPIAKESTRETLKIDLDSRINQLRSELRSLPFGLQSSGSIKKREKIETQIKDFEKERKKLDKKWSMR
jgi:hypothetical protein